MKTKRRTRKRRVLTRHTSAERTRLLKEFQQSGQRQADFCRDHGVNATTFNGWLRRSAKSKPTFAEVAVPLKPAGDIEIDLPNGVRVHLPVVGDPQQTAELIRRVAGC